jgi:ribosomal-protein-alanine N-acetyltransferase
MMPTSGKIEPTASLFVRAMLPSDVPEALSILQDSPEASNWSAASLMQLAASGETWVAEQDGRLAGILVGRVAADEFEILNLAVAKRNRRKGIAKRMVEAALERAHLAGVTRTYLEVRSSNDGAIRFYQRLDFQAKGRRASYYKSPTEDAVVMVLRRGGTPA